MTHPSRHDVLGSTVTMPVEIRRARCFVAGFTADARAMQAAIDAAGDTRGALAPLRIRRDRGMCMLVFVDYIDGDLGPYNEFGVCFLVDPTTTDDAPGPGDSRSGGSWSGLRSLFAGDARALIHRLPVDVSSPSPPDAGSGDSRRFSPTSTSTTSRRPGTAG